MSFVPAAARGRFLTRRAALQAGSAAAALLALSASPVFAGTGPTQATDPAQPAPAAGAARLPDDALQIEVGDIYTSLDGEHGVVAENEGDLSVKAGTINTEGYFAHGIVTWTETGSNTVIATNVATFGDESLGIVAQSRDGDVSVTVENVLTAGAVSDAVIATSETGDVDVTIGTVRTEGEDAWGLYAISGLGETRVNVGSVETLRDGGIGLVVGGGAGASVTVESIVTSGYRAGGVQMVAGNNDESGTFFGDAVLRAGTIETRGAQATAVSVVAVGNADVEVGSARTQGEFSDGVTSYSRYGDSRVVVDMVHTSGFNSAGMVSVTDNGDLDITAREVVTEADSSSGIRAIVRTGNLDLLAGDVTTAGTGSHGVITTVVRGDANVETRGVIQTRGDHANGIMAATAGHTAITAADVRTSGVGANGIDVFSAHATWGVPNARSIDIVAGSISTEGASAHGIRVAMPEGGVIIGGAEPAVRPAPTAAAPEDDAVSIRAGSVTVKGEGSVGIWAQGLGAVTVEADHVTSQLGEAIRIDARADASVTLNGNVSGGASAVNVTGEDITLKVAKTAVVTGAQDAVVLAAQGPYTPPPEEVRAPASAGVSTLDNAGVIRAGTGSAVRVTSGTAIINNSGRIEGALTLGDGDDKVVNTGTLVMTANNDMGTGVDLFTNKGVVQFGKAAAPLNLSFLGLERFVNEGGLIDLRNERAGDTLTLSGAYEASGDARLALDVGPTAVDSLVVQGAATGKTSIVLNARPEDATLLDKSLRLVTVASGSSVGAFRLADADVGLIRYGLAFDSKTNAYMLNASAGRAVEQSVLASEGLVSAWRASADAFNAEQAMARAAGGERARVWAQAHGSTIDHDGEALALGYEQELTGGQMGVSLGARPMLGGLAAFGLTGGFVDSTASFAEDGQEVDMQTINAGAYGAWRAENLFATGLVKVDQHTLEIADRAAGFKADIDGLSWGVQLAAGYRFEIGQIAFEPTVGLDYLSSTLDDLNVLKQSVTFDDHDGFSARIGGQALSRRELADGRAITWSVGLEAVHDFDAGYGGSLHSNGETEAVLIEGPEGYSRAQVGAQFEVGGGLETYVQGEGRFGGGQSGGGLRIGARYRF